MTIATFSRKEIEKHIKLTEENIEKISLLGTPLEKITSDELEIEVFPNRPDLISMHGFLRAFKAFIGKETGLKKYKVNKPEKDYKIKIDKSVESIRPYTACAIVKNLSEKYVIPVVGIFVSSGEWLKWSNSSEPWSDIFKAVYAKRAMIVPFRWWLKLLLSIRSFIGI